MCQALPFVVNIAQANAAASRVFTVVQRVSRIDPLANTGITYRQIQGEVRFEDVCFAYPSQPERNVLKGVDFVVPAGHTVAFVGASGSGKSTVFALLERFYCQTSGRITLDGEPIDEMNVSWLRSQIGYVGQDVSLFRASIHDNIAYGLPRTALEVFHDSLLLSLELERLICDYRVWEHMQYGGWSSRLPRLLKSILSLRACPKVTIPC